MVPKEGTRVSRFDKKTHKDLAGYAAYLNSINTVEVQAGAEVPQGPEVDGLTELKAFLLSKHEDDIARNILRRLLTYGIGRELTWRDRFAVAELLKQSKKDEHRFQDMIVAICQSETFRGK